MTRTDGLDPEPTLLRAGHSGEPVRDLQARLSVAVGARLEVTGVFDPATEAAVRGFQETRGLRVDGICGPETWGALIESGFGLGDRLLYLRRPNLRGDDVAALQARLNGLGFDAGREDGILGPETESAVRQFQRNAGLTPDGVCGPATLDGLARLGSLAAGSVASVREREQLRREPSRLEDRNVYVVVEPGLDALGDAVARGLRSAGAVVVLDPSGEDPGLAAAAANRFNADVFLAVGSGSEPGVRVAYFANRQFRSEAGYCIAQRCTEELAAVLAVEEPVGKTYRVLRETRMAAIACELFARGDPDGARLLVPRAAAIASAIVDGLRRGVEQPIDLTEPVEVIAPTEA